ncbi:hypothetical protein AcW2_006249 [Taiwanofungus camphoratus]|nr:hypothetical protein AcW2_006249 [Antrodia cinnamomea]
MLSHAEMDYPFAASMFVRNKVDPAASRLRYRKSVDTPMLTALTSLELLDLQEGWVPSMNAFLDIPPALETMTVYHSGQISGDSNTDPGRMMRTVSLLCLRSLRLKNTPNDIAYPLAHYLDR